MSSEREGVARPWSLTAGSVWTVAVSVGIALWTLVHATGSPGVSGVLLTVVPSAGVSLAYIRPRRWTLVLADAVLIAAVVELSIFDLFIAYVPPLILMLAATFSVFAHTDRVQAEQHS